MISRLLTILQNQNNAADAGNAGDDIIASLPGAQLIDGGAGNDTISYAASNAGVTVSLMNNAAGIGGHAAGDTFNSIENITGSAFNDKLTGDANANVLNGGKGADTLTGGAGNDTYVVDNKSDKVIEAAGGGIDTVNASITYTLGANVENLTLTGSASLNGTGNSLNNILTGNAGKNTLNGGSGNDTLNGGAGADTLIGGKGNDIYVVDNRSDKVTEAASSGTDTVNASITYTLGSNVENLTLTGTANINGTGNTLNNVLTGNAGINTLTGGAGNDTLDGGAGNDTLIGGAGNDTYVVDHADDKITEKAKEGTDTVRSTVTHTLGDNVENLTLIGTAAIDGTGNQLANVMTGNSAENEFSGMAGNDVISGAAGNDELDGGAGNDDLFGGENQDTLKGGEGNDRLYGGSDGDTLIGGEGNDLLDGGAGADSMSGDKGDDTYVVTGALDSVSEKANEGTDTVRSMLTETLDSNVENLVLLGEGDLNGTGNELDNVITGNDGANDLRGNDGDDTIYGGASEDSVYGGSGNNQLYGGAGDDKIYGGSGNNQLYGGDGGDFLTGYDATILLDEEGSSISSGDDTNKLYGGAGNDQYALRGNVEIFEDENGGSDTVFASADYTLLDNFENLRLEGSNLTGTGNALDNEMYADDNGSTLNGEAGNDTLYGGSYGANTLIGGAGDDKLYGNDQDDALYGGVGNDMLSGGAGNDVAVFSGDTIADYSYSWNAETETLTVTDTRANSDGTDTLTGIERLQFGDEIYIGNLSHLDLSAARTLNGTDGDDTLTGANGNDTLDGGAGTDTMIGGAGDDTYFADSYTDGVTELAGGGTDTLFFNGLYAYELRANVENLTLTGEGDVAGLGNDADNVITGNSGDNNLYGIDGNDTLIGGGGDDVLSGGDGNDMAVFSGNRADYTFTWDGNSLIVTGADGTDTVYSDIESLKFKDETYTDALELLDTTPRTVTGDEDSNYLYGAAGDDTLTGLAGSDELYGGLGNDTMIGGVGSDSYYVDSTGDIVTELENEGRDAVYSSIDYTLGANFEDLRLEGGGNINGTGNDADNFIRGNSADNILTGGLGNDTLSGGHGNDTAVFSGLRKDYTFSWNGYTLTVTGADGTDLLYTDIESLKFTGDNEIVTAALESLDTTPRTFVGDADANTSYGAGGDDNLSGLGGSDQLYGGLGNDTLNGGDGNDGLNGDAGNDTLDGGAGNDYLFGGEGNDALYGGAGNDYLYGGAGNAQLDGGGGNDIYAVGSTGDIVTELADEGTTDTVQSSITYTLGANLENLTLTGATAINGTGNDANNVIRGNSADNILAGGLGNDMLYGGIGNDTLIGGAGDDFYDVNSTGDSVTEAAGAGTDTVSTVIDYTLGANLENLTLTGGTAINGTGNDAGNVISGNSGNNILTGGLGNDTLSGGAGNDTAVFSGKQSDYTFSWNADTSTLTVIDTRTEGSSGTDTITGIENLKFSDGTYSGPVSHLDLSAARTLNGTAGDDTLTGANGDDTLTGGEGNDTAVFSGKQSDYTFSWNADTSTLTVIDTRTEGSSGTDTITGIENLKFSDGTYGGDISYLDPSVARTLNGTAGDDILTGANGDDTLTGGEGNDTAVFSGKQSDYTFSWNADYSTLTVTDTRTEGSSGNDTITGIENLKFSDGTYSGDLSQLDSWVDRTLNGTQSDDTLTGANGNDTLTGGEGKDILNGGGNDDLLNGGAGDDTLNGGDGNDTAVYSGSINQHVISLNEDGSFTVTGEGTDTLTGVETMLFGDTSYQLGSFDGKALINDKTLIYVSEATTNGTGFDDFIFGRSTAETIDGGSGNDIIYGAGGADTLNGGEGDDKLYGGEYATEFFGGAGNDLIVGGSSGGDVAVLIEAEPNQFAFGHQAGIFTVISAANGSDELSGIEKVKIGGSTYSISSYENVVTLTDDFSTSKTIYGTYYNNMLVGGDYNEDQVIFSEGVRADYTVQLENGVITITSADTGKDMLLSIERLVFTDGTYSLDGQGGLTLMV